MREKKKKISKFQHTAIKVNMVKTKFEKMVLRNCEKLLNQSFENGSQEISDMIRPMEIKDKNKKNLVIRIFEKVKEIRTAKLNCKYYIDKNVESLVWQSLIILLTLNGCKSYPLSKMISYFYELNLEKNTEKRNDTKKNFEWMDYLNTNFAGLDSLDFDKEKYPFKYWKCKNCNKCFYTTQEVTNPVCQIKCKKQTKIQKISKEIFIQTHLKNKSKRLILNDFFSHTIIGSKQVENVIAFRVVNLFKMCSLLGQKLLNSSKFEKIYKLKKQLEKTNYFKNKDSVIYLVHQIKNEVHYIKRIYRLEYNPYDSIRKLFQEFKFILEELGETWNQTDSELGKGSNIVNDQYADSNELLYTKLRKKMEHFKALAEHENKVKYEEIFGELHNPSANMKISIMHIEELKNTKPEIQIKKQFAKMFAQCLQFKDPYRSIDLKETLILQKNKSTNNLKFIQYYLQNQSYLESKINDLFFDNLYFVKNIGKFIEFRFSLNELKSMNLHSVFYKLQISVDDKSIKKVKRKVKRNIPLDSAESVTFDFYRFKKSWEHFYKNQENSAFKEIKHIFEHDLTIEKKHNEEKSKQFQSDSENKSEESLNESYIESSENSDNEENTKNTNIDFEEDDDSLLIEKEFSIYKFYRNIQVENIKLENLLLNSKFTHVSYVMKLIKSIAKYQNSIVKTYYTIQKNNKRKDSESTHFFEKKANNNAFKNVYSANPNEIINCEQNLMEKIFTNTAEYQFQTEEKLINLINNNLKEKVLGNLPLLEFEDTKEMDYRLKGDLILNQKWIINLEAKLNPECLSQQEVKKLNNFLDENLDQITFLYNMTSEVIWDMIHIKENISFENMSIKNFLQDYCNIKFEKNTNLKWIWRQQLPKIFEIFERIEQEVYPYLKSEFYKFAEPVKSSRVLKKIKQSDPKELNIICCGLKKIICRINKCPEIQDKSLSDIMFNFTSIFVHPKKKYIQNQIQSIRNSLKEKGTYYLMFLNKRS